MLVAVIVLVLQFRSSGARWRRLRHRRVGHDDHHHLLTAYIVVMTQARMRIGLLVALALFGLLESLFFSSNLTKLGEGGWMPMALGAVIFLMLTTWKEGSRLLARQREQIDVPLDGFVKGPPPDVPRVPGTAVYLTSEPSLVPSALFRNLKHCKVMHERTVFLHVVNRMCRASTMQARGGRHPAGAGLYNVDARFGFGRSRRARRPGPGRSPGLDLEPRPPPSSWPGRASSTARASCRAGAATCSRGWCASRKGLRATSGCRPIRWWAGHAGDAVAPGGRQSYCARLNGRRRVWLCRATVRGVADLPITINAHASCQPLCRRDGSRVPSSHGAASWPLDWPSLSVTTIPANFRFSRSLWLLGGFAGLEAEWIDLWRTVHRQRANHWRRAVGVAAGVLPVPVRVRPPARGRGRPTRRARLTLAVWRRSVGRRRTCPLLALVGIGAAMSDASLPTLGILPVTCLALQAPPLAGSGCCGRSVPAAGLAPGGCAQPDPGRADGAGALIAYGVLGAGGAGGRLVSASVINHQRSRSSVFRVYGWRGRRRPSSSRLMRLRLLDIFQVEALTRLRVAKGETDRASGEQGRSTAVRR